MAKDSLGNDIGAVGVPITGSIGFAPAGTSIPTPAAGGALDYELPAAFRKAGLIKEDGGFEWTLEPDGDPLRFFQEGYSIPSGLANVSLAVGLAQFDDLVRELSYGAVPDENGFLLIDGGGHSNRYVVWSEEIFKNGGILRTIAADVGVTTAQVDRSERGAIKGTNLTLDVARSPLLENKHIGQWYIPPEAA